MTNKRNLKIPDQDDKEEADLNCFIHQMHLHCAQFSSKRSCFDQTSGLSGFCVTLMITFNCFHSNGKSFISSWIHACHMCCQLSWAEQIYECTIIWLTSRGSFTHLRFGGFWDLCKFGLRGTFHLSPLGMQLTWWIKRHWTIFAISSGSHIVRWAV